MDAAHDGPILMYKIPLLAIVVCGSGCFDYASLNRCWDGGCGGDDQSASSDLLDGSSTPADLAIAYDLGPPACDPSVQPTDGVFVSVVNGNDLSGQGSQLLPFKTIATGLTAAAASGLHFVYLDEGTYPENINFSASSAGLFVSGGWKALGATWSRDCAPDFVSRTVIASPTAVAVKVSGVTVPSGLINLTVATRAKGLSSANTSGETVIGVLVTGVNSTFRLTGVNVLTGQGGDGGSASVPPDAMNLTCSGSDPGTGMAGSVGTAGMPGKAGVLGATAFTPGDGMPGLTAMTGASGTAPAIAPETGMCVSSCSGTCGGFCGDVADTCSGAPGKNGCGGQPGLPGSPGRGGGASIGIFASGAGAIVALDHTVVRAQKGGDGSTGGTAGKPGLGTAGSTGNPVTANTHCYSPACASIPNCGTNSPHTFAGGSKGGDGGPGGKGGDGGGGAGGPSYGSVTLDGARVLVDANSITLGGVGGTGAGGAPAGATASTFP